ncbi:MAG TPA: porin family protein [Draconibacterium sp.]|nr:porin family protein [Draconibacterium sp.]
MKKIFTAILFITIISNAFAQKQMVNYLTTFDEKLIHFGFTLGYNMLDFNITNYNPIGENPDFVADPGDDLHITGGSMVRSDLQTLVPGFTVGIVSSLRLSEDLDLRFLPGMSFGERKLTYNIPVYDINAGFEPIKFYSIKSTFLDFPLLIKYKARRINNDRPFVIFGTAFRQDISKTAKEDLVKLKSSGFYAEVGGGWDHYFPFFRFTVEGKFSFGLNNQLGDLPEPIQRQYYSQSIKSLRSNIFTLSFHFE